MTNGSITNRDLYNTINEFRKEIRSMMDKQEDECRERYKAVAVKVESNTNWRNKVIGQFTVIMIVVGAGINWLFSLLGKKD